MPRDSISSLSLQTETKRHDTNSYTYTLVLLGLKKKTYVLASVQAMQIISYFKASLNRIYLM